MHGGTQVFVAGAAQADHVHLAGGERDRRGADDALQFLGRGKSFAVVAAFGEHAWGEFVPQSGERTEQFVVRVLFEQLANAAAILFELFLERDELPSDGDGQSALGSGDGRGAVELVGPRDLYVLFLSSSSSSPSHFVTPYASMSSNV
jgi:hypothetical protein